MQFKKYIYSYFFFFIIFIFIVDELSFILYNISLYQIFCGSNFIKIYESYFKLPINHLQMITINAYDNILVGYENCNSYYELKNNLYIYKNEEIEIINDSFIKNTEKTINYKDNTWKDNISVHANEINNIFLVHFDTLTTQKHKIEFEILQNKIYICPGESTLAFFRISNLTNETIQAFSIYVVSPTEFTPFINKLQCFCYEELLLYPKETIDLPVLFRIENDITKLDNVSKELVIEYIIVF